MRDREFWAEVRRGLLLIRRGVRSPLVAGGIGVIVEAIARRHNLQPTERAASGRRFRRVAPGELIARIRGRPFIDR